MELTQNPSVLELVRKTAELATPKEIVWIDGSESQLDSLRKIAVETGELIKLNEEKLPGCVYHRSALNDVRTKGYGVVAPAPGDLQLAEPEIVRKGGRYGVRLKASAKAIHMFQTNIETEISPEIGGENASSEILGFLLQGFDGDVEQLWQSNIFGKPIYTIAQEGVEEKLSCLPTKAVGKLQETLQRVVNEGSGTLICIIL